MMENFKVRRIIKDYENRLWDMKIIAWFGVTLGVLMGMIVGMLIERGF
jgi:hypothetical protein